MPETGAGGRKKHHTFHTFTKVTATSETEIGEVLHKVGYHKKRVAKSWLRLVLSRKSYLEVESAFVFIVNK